MDSTRNPTATTPHQRQSIRVTKSTSTSYIPGTTTTITKAFESDPLTIYLLNKVPWHNRRAAMYHLFQAADIGAQSVGGIFWEASTYESDSSTTEPRFQTSAAILPPGKSLDDVPLWGWLKMGLDGSLPMILWYAGTTPITRVMDKYASLVKTAKAATFTSRETYFYVAQIGTDSNHRGKGLASALIKDLQVKAQDEMKPIWLEASNLGARKVYTKCGFADVDVEIVVGRGECDETGEKAQGERAVGVKMWPMVWWPEGYKKFC